MSKFENRKKEIIAMAAGPFSLPGNIKYVSSENEVWEAVSTALAPLWDKVVVSDVLEARARLKLPIDHVPQLAAVTSRLNKLSGFKFRSVGGLVERDIFFKGLSDGLFLSTQYLRHPSSPFYTDEPDIIHEVIGHGTLLAIPELADLHRLAGVALLSVETEEAKQFIANVWWFSGEFGVILTEDGPKAFGAGLLSSVGELEHFTKKAEINPLDIPAMGLTSYRIDEFQKILFAGYSVHHIHDVVGGFFKNVTDKQVQEMTKEFSSRKTTRAVMDLEDIVD